MQDIDLRDLEKMRSLLESLEETNYFRENDRKRIKLLEFVDILEDIDTEIDSFFKEDDTADPNDVLQAVLDLRTEQFMKELKD